MITPRHARPVAPLARERGMTLIELMISLVLGMVLIGGVLVVFLGTRAAFTTTDNLARLQDSARIANALLSREVREATSTGCGNGSRSDNVIARRNESTLNAAQSANPAWWSQMGQGIQGYDANVATPAVAIGSTTGLRTSTTDAIQVTGAFGTSYAIDLHDNIGGMFTLNTASSGIAIGDILIACDYKQSSVFKATKSATTKISYAAGAGTSDNCNTALGYDATNVCPTNSYKYDSLVSRLSRFGASTWYIGNGSNGRPSLFRIFLTGGPEEIAPGVTDMQITYFQNGNAAYVAASAITDWGQVLAARVTLSFESQEKGVTTATTGERRLTTTTTSTIMLRNRTP